MGNTEIIDDDVRVAVHRAQERSNTPLDGGWGLLDDTVMRPAVSDAASKIVGISYAGEIPIPPAEIPVGFKPFPTLP